MPYISYAIINVNSPEKTEVLVHSLTCTTVETSLSTDTMQWQFSLENETGSFVLESTIGAVDYFINEDFTMATQQPADDSKAFDTQSGIAVGSTYDDILDFSERNPFGEVDE